MNVSPSLYRLDFKIKFKTYFLSFILIVYSHGEYINALK